ncbi:hypothetical protein FXO37_11605 [Capsicum annuum]|nr:hypothetical protein FXO37_11605 [Capsicum annuum]
MRLILHSSVSAFCGRELATEFAPFARCGDLTPDLLLKEIEAKMNALRDEKRATLDSIEAEYKGQLAGLRRVAETEEQKLAEQWAYKHLRLAKLLEQMGCQSRLAEPNGGC